MKQNITVIAITLAILISCNGNPKSHALYSTAWQPDTLADNYEMRYVKQPDDYSGSVRSTIIRKHSACDSSNKAILYIHGFNDYFFQKEMGNRFSDSCYNFYAVDLRKYGRSIINTQNKFEVKNINEYYADIDSALSQIVADGNKHITIIGHSTGGLIAASYLNDIDSSKYPIANLVLNSPFLDWNLSQMQENILVPIVSKLPQMFSNIKISQGGGNAYSQSLLKKYHGEWNYNTDWKMEISPDVTIGWISAIENAQKKLHSTDTDVNCPTLVLHSDKSVGGKEWTPEFNHADAVLDVNDIDHYGRLLSDNVTIITEKGGLHDLILSEKPVREKVYSDIFSWLKSEENF